MKLEQHKRLLPISFKVIPGALGLYVSLLLLFCLLPVSFYAQQDSVMLDKSFQFADGVYLSFDAFRANEPSYEWRELDAKVAGTPGSFSAQADFFITKAGDTLSRADIWGICLNGLPYVCLKNEEAGEGPIKFAGMKVRGRLCLYEFETQKTEWVEIAAYNPLTGKPFRRGKVSKSVTTEHQYLLDLTTGEIKPFNRSSLLSFIEDDEQLWRTVRDLSEEEAGEKLYRCLLIYDDRNPIYLPAPNVD